MDVRVLSVDGREVARVAGGLGLAGANRGQLIRCGGEWCEPVGGVPRGDGGGQILDPANGKLLWKHDTQSSIWASALIADGTMAAIFHSHGLTYRPPQSF